MILFKDGVKVKVIKEYATSYDLGFEVLVFKVTFSFVEDPLARIDNNPLIGDVS